LCNFETRSILRHYSPKRSLGLLDLVVPDVPNIRQYYEDTTCVK